MSVRILEKSPKNHATTTGEVECRLPQDAGSHVSVLEYLEHKSYGGVNSSLSCAAHKVREYVHRNVSIPSVLPKISDREKAILSQMYQKLTAGAIHRFFTHDIRTFHGRGEIVREGWRVICLEYLSMRESYHAVKHVHPLSFLSWISGESMIKEHLKKIHGYTHQWSVFLRLLNQHRVQATDTPFGLDSMQIAPWDNIIKNFQKSMEALYHTEDLCLDAFLETMPQNKRKGLQKCIQKQKYEALFKNVVEA